MESEKKVCCFFGHRKISGADELRKKVYGIVEDLIVNENVDKFLFGSKSEFDKLCLNVVTELKAKYPHISRVYIRAEYQYITDDYREYLLESYEDTYFSERAIGAGKAVYIERNREMIDNSDFCVAYYKEDYEPPRRKNSRRDLTDYQPKSGTKTAYEYALKKNKNVIQVTDFMA